MNTKVIALIFVVIECMLLAGQITTLVSTRWTTWNLRFNWTEGREYGRGPMTDGQLVSEGYAGLWERCLRIYDTSREDEFSTPYNCLHNYNVSNGSFRYEFGKACKIATAALCIGDTVLIISVIITVIISICKTSSSKTLMKVSLALLLLQGLICVAIPLTYLTGNMAELIDQLSTAYGLLRIVRMTTIYNHDWAFWAQVCLIGVWSLGVAAFVFFYSSKLSLNYSTRNKAVNGRQETADETEMEVLKA